MRCGVTLPNLGLPGGPATLVDLAVEAEQAGWDGVFVWDSGWSPDWDEVFLDDPERRATWDPWVLLTAMAVATERVRLGPLVTPLTRRRPWKLAAETATLDQLSGGRLVLAVSLGWAPDGFFAKTDEVTDRRTRAERLDEALDIVTAMWRGEPVTHHGQHFQVDDLLGPPARQQPRIPVWVVGAWPSEPSMARALRYDGLVPAVRMPEGHFDQPSAEQLGPITAAVRDRAGAEFDVVVEGNTSRDAGKAAARVGQWAEAGATWWLEGIWKFLYEPATALERMRDRLRAGPPPVPAEVA